MILVRNLINFSEVSNIFLVRFDGFFIGFWMKFDRLINVSLLMNLLKIDKFPIGILIKRLIDLLKIWLKSWLKDW